MDIPDIACRLLCLFVWRIAGFCNPVGHRLFCMHSQMSRVFVEIARTAEKFPSFLAHIDRNRQNLLLVEFVVADALVVGCDCAGRTIRSIDRSRPHGGVGFGLSRLKPRGLKDK